jgi:hypothetical protein
MPDKPLLEPEKLRSPTQEARNEVGMNTPLSIFYLIDHPQFGKLFFSGSNCITTQFFFCRG